ncbi:MAG: DUF1588 domain-containing protein [Pirellulaceae bacterium]
MFAHTSATAAPLDASANKFLRTYCGDCHCEGADEGGFQIETDDIDWSNHGSLVAWEHIHAMVSRGIMPPHDADQPPEAERAEFLQLADKYLVQHSRIGGTTLRRLNRREYSKTIERLFGLSNFSLPASFPPDNEANGFDNQADALVVASSHLEALSETASLIADQLFPPPPKEIIAKTFQVPAHEMVVSYSSACLIDGQMRLASSGDNIVRNATWPTKFEAPASGVYQLTINLSSHNPPATTPVLTVATMRAADRSDVNLVQEITVDSQDVTSSHLKIRLNKGDTVALRYLNGPLVYEDVPKFESFLTELFTNNPKLAAAWDHVGNPPRGGSGWQRVKEAMGNQDLDVAKFKDNETAVSELVKRVAKNKVNSGETLVYKFFEEGPAIAIHRMTLHGPIKRIRDRDQIRSDNLRESFVGKDFDDSDLNSLQQLMQRFLSAAFRRPATENEIAGYASLIQQTATETGSIDQGLHLAIRTALISPAFLYRGFHDGVLSDHDLATRLSYFLTSAPPSESLQKAVHAGKLSRPAVLQKETLRLLGRDFSKEFSTQWLGTDEVDNLMPDLRLIKRFSPEHRQVFRDEVTETFHHILTENLPVTEFINPNFVFTNQTVGWEIYALEQLKPSKKNRATKSNRKKIAKFTLPADSHRGGLLTMPAVMMSTANGVDTQPVLRGVWVLENIFGTPPPEPPNAVPALTPDTSSATTVKQRLAAHMSDESCAQCHREIDPIGFALESFDPIGRWRDHYPLYRDQDGEPVIEKGNRVDTTGELPDGTEIKDVVDLKQWLANHPELFARCLSEKLLTYAVGRRLNYREKKLIAEIVTEQRESNDLRFRDLLVALVGSEIFRTK